MGYPLVSVIIATFNRSKFLPKAIKSVLEQTYQNVEVIIVDDCSTDDTYKMVKEFSDSRIKYIRNQKNLGLAASRNRGIKISKGEYISFLDDDDEWMPEKLEKQIKKFRKTNHNVGVVYCGHQGVFNGKVIYKKVPECKGNILDKALRTCPSAIHTPLIKKECLKKAGLFDEEFPTREDWDLWIRLAKICEFDFVPDILAVYNFHSNQMTGNLKKMILGREMILNKHIDELSQRKEILSWHLRRLGSLYCLDNQYSKGRRYLLQSIKTYPLNKGSYVHIILSYISKSLHKKMIKKYGAKVVGDIKIFL